MSLRVSDDGRGTSISGASSPGGHGIVGMRERVATFGGSVHAGPLPGGGFEVSASIPYAVERGRHHPRRANRQETGRYMIRVLVVDDQDLVRDGFAVLLALCDDIEVVGQAANGAEALAMAINERPDVMLMDIRMPEMDGLEATRQLANDTRTASCRVLILTTFDLDEYVFEALRLGASGFLLKDTKRDQLIDAVRIVASGESLLSPKVTSRLIAEFAQQPTLDQSKVRLLSSITDREREVLLAIARGESNADIAASLFMGAGTVKTHVSHLLTKVGARDRAQLVVFAYESGLVMPGSE